MSYCAVNDVTDELGTAYDSTTDLTTAQVTEFIVQADGVIDHAASRHYWPFNAHDSATYQTPEHVKRASIDLAVAYSLQKLRATARATALTDRIDMYFEKAGGALEELASGTAWIEPESVATETLSGFTVPTWGWELDETQAFVAATSPLDSGDAPNIFPDSAAILSTSTPGADVTFTAAQMANMRTGVEFAVHYSPGHRRWVFNAIHSELKDVTTLNITYRWDYRRQFADMRLKSGVLLS